MPCEFLLKSEKQNCQFGLPDGELIAFDGGLRCQYHLPITDIKGNRTKKGCWDDAEIVGFNNAVKQLMLRQKNHVGKVVMSGVVFPGNIDFEQIINGKDVWNSGANFEGAEFFGSVHFKKISFRNNFEAMGALFHSDLVFSECNFYGTGKFDEIRVVGNVGFPNVVFHQESSFCKIRFESLTSFTSVQFIGVSNFKSSIFGGELEEREKVTHDEGLNFSNARFSGKNDFSLGKFYCNSDFSACNFGVESVFLNCVFGRDKDSEARFSQTTFSKAQFDGSNFKGIVSFQKGVLGGEFSFVGVEIGKNAIFLEANFSQNSNFKECCVEGDVLFQWASFGGPIYLEGAKFKGMLNFFEAKFVSSFRAEKIYVGGLTSFGCGIKKAGSGKHNDDEGFKYLTLKGSRFNGSITFNNRIFLASTDFSECTFVKAPKFFECELHQDTKFPSSKYFLDKSSEAGASYRKLKLEMEKIRARQEEGMFNALEQECQISDPSVPKMDKTLSKAYDIFSGYGQSLTKPLGWMGGILISFYCLYLLMAKNINLKSPDCLIYLVRIFGFVVEQMVNPFKVWRLDESPIWFCGCIDLVFLKLAATMQSLLFLAFFALFILSLRWRFKRG